MIRKLLSVFLVLVLALSMVSISNADDEPVNPLSIEDIDIDGTDMDDIKYLQVERGERLSIRVEVQSFEDLKDVRIKADIAGYEYDDLEVTSPIFDMTRDRRYVENLILTIPEDINPNEDYKLRIKVYNQEFETQEFPTPTLTIESQRHLLKIMDVMFTPGLTINAGQPLFVTARIENLGGKDEDDVKVEVSIPQLGKSGVTYIDELVAIEESDDDVDSDSSDTIYIDTKGAQAGTYDLIVRVTYNRGHDVLTENYQLVIDGVTAGAQDVLVSAVETSKSVEAEQGIVYEVDIANMGVNARIFTVEINGLDWGNYRIDPMPVVVQAGSSQKMFVYISPNEDVIGQKAFTVNVKEGNNVVEQLSFQANISESRSEWGNVLTGLEIGFVVLLIILVILGIILAATRMGKKEDNEEPLGETYY